MAARTARHAIHHMCTPQCTDLELKVECLVCRVKSLHCKVRAALTIWHSTDLKIKVLQQLHQWACIKPRSGVTCKAIPGADLSQAWLAEL